MDLSVYWRGVMKITQWGAIAFLVLQGLVSLLGYRVMTGVLLSMFISSAVINRIATRKFHFHWGKCLRMHDEKENNA
jgi:hypothetical protein